MTLPLGYTAVLELDGQQWSVRDGRVEILAGEEPVPGPQVCFTDFGGALQGVEQITASRRYAAAIIEKTLRDRGDTEGSNEVLLVRASSSGGSTRALYSALPVERFEEYSRRANGHADHCLLTPYTAVLAKRAGKVQDKTVYLLFQHGLDIDLLVLVDKAPYTFIRVTASGSAQEDWERALRFLSGELGILQARMEQPEGSALWVDWDPMQRGDARAIRTWLETNSNLRLDAEEEHELSFEGRTFNASLPSLFSFWNGTLAVNPPPAQILYAAERALPFAVMAIAGLSLALCVAAFQWRGQALQLDSANTGAPAGVAQLDLAAIRAQVADTAGPTDSREDIDFVERLYRAHALPSLARVIADVRAVLPAICNVTGLALDTSRGDARLILEGWVDAEPTAINRTIEDMIRALGRRGYPVRDNGLMALEQRDMFQLELILEESLDEI